MSLKNKLQLYKSHLNKDEGTAPQKPLSERKTAVPAIQLSGDWEGEAIRLYQCGEQYCYIREVEYPLDYQHGKYRFSDFLQAVSMWDGSMREHPLNAHGLEADRLFFFDTETTGLGGGTGNTIFLLGHARVQEGKVKVTQHFLPEPGNEVALYSSFLEQVDYTTLVTYNGKSFDWPQVKTRHTLVREHVPKLPSFGHFDLYHAARRLWKGDLDKVKLANVEKHVLDFERKDDVPGYLAPMIYFDYVDRKDPEAIIKVMKHNEQDILSLITLYTHLTLQIHCVAPSQSAKEKMRVGTWLNDVGSKTLAIEAWKQAAREDDFEAMYRLAFVEKKAGNIDSASNLWKAALQTENLTVQQSAYIELAKLAEHQHNDYEEAIAYVQEALSVYGNNKMLKKSNRFLQEGEHRIKRLEGKLRKKT